MKPLRLSLVGKWACIILVVSFLLSAAAAQTNGSPAQFDVKRDAGALVSLRPTFGARETEFIRSGGRLGGIMIRCRQGNGDWQSLNSDSSVSTEVGQPSNATGKQTVVRQLTNGAIALNTEIQWDIREREILWTIRVQNVTTNPIEIGDLAVPLPINRGGRRGGNFSPDSSDSVILKHSFISGHGSFLFWMRSDSVAPYLTLTPTGDTHLEYWESQPGGDYRVFIHSTAAGTVAKEHGTNWRQPHTSLMLAAKGNSGDARAYGFKFRWADGYDAVRQILVDEGLIDVQVVPGMTLPSDLAARFALRTKQKIARIEAEFPNATKVESLGTKGDLHLYQVRFSRLGENRLTVQYGDNRHLFLEFFSTEPLETLIKKRGAFLARSQHRDPRKWYDGLITDWNMETQKLLSPDDYAPIPRNRYYAVTCDDPGLGKPAFLAAKNAEFPVQSEVEALDYYVQHFVWGGLQRTTEEKYSYAIYGIPDWKTNRESTDPGRNGQLHLWREYDYPHVIQMYFAMYQLAKNHPEIRTALQAREYLQRAFGTAQAFFTVPHEIWNGWSPYGTGFYNELIIVDLITELEKAGMRDEAGTLRGFWERKVKNFVNRDQDLFRSEYAFDSTGFESTHALAKYAMHYGDPPGRTNSGIPLANAKKFLEKQMAGNLFCRGWLEPAYYYLGSDYRGGGGNAYVLTYMSQMGGWSVLDYALNFATNPAPYLRLGYASYLSAWASMNTGTPESNYGYWYPGKANDGGAGGGFEPAPYGRTWLGQPHHRGSWSFASEIDLGYCGALRSAATVLSDDPIFGRFCFGGDWHKIAKGIEVVPKDGLRRRFHAMLDAGRLHLLLDSDRFASGQPIILKEDLSEIRFQLESDCVMKHIATLHLSGVTPGKYSVRCGNDVIATLNCKTEEETTVDLPVESAGNQSVVIQRSK